MLAIINGTTDNDTLTGNSEDDLFTGDAGDDLLIGGGGSDVARFLGNHDEYQLSTDQTGKVTVRDLNAANGDEGADTLDGDMTLRFADGDYLANVISRGGIIRANTTTLSDQIYPAMTALADGGFVISWQSLSQDGSSNGIYAQRYNAEGIAQGNEFQISTTTTTAFDQERPSITGLADGGFVVSWESYNSISTDIFVQRYKADGTKQGGEFLVNTTISDFQSNSTITALTDGGFVVSWQSLNQDGDEYGIYAQRFKADGTAQGNEFQVNTTTDGLQRFPKIAELADGGFVISWASYEVGAPNVDVFAQRYSSDGSSQGGEFKVNLTRNSDTEVTIAGLPDGGFVISWESADLIGGDWDIYAQRYNADGTPRGGEFLVNTHTANDHQITPSITALTDGGFVVIWESVDTDAPIFGQRFRADGTAQGGEFHVFTNSFSGGLNPTITELADGGFVVSWMSWKPADTSFDILAQRFDANGNPVQSIVQLSAVDTSAPTATNLSLAQTYTEDNALNLTDIVISDNDSANVTATLTLSNPAAGSLTTATSGTVTSSFDPNVGLWTASGAIADVNTLLAGVSFNPAPNFNGDFTINTSMSDGVSAPATGSKAMTGTAVNDAPQLTGTPISLADGTEDTDYMVTAVSLLTGWTDIDSATLSVQNLTVDHGIVIDNGDSSFTIQSEVNYNGPVTLDYHVSDGATNIPASLQFTLIADANQPPVLNTVLIPQAVKSGNALNYNARTAFNDPDGDTLNFSATLANGDALPTWLHIDPSTGILSGTPGTGDRGTYALTVKATDPHLADITAPATVAVTSIDAGNLLVSTAGNDILTGTAANDTVTYGYATAAVTISLAIAAQQNTLGGGLDTLTAINNLIGGNFNDQLTGNGQNNALEGGAGNDTLNGAGGADAMAGGLGDDIFTVNQAGDIVTELLNEGIDRVNSNLTYTLLANIENLTLTGTSAINGNGNELNNVIIGNSANNELNGQAGSDTLNGGGGNDTLIGGLGADIMIGGAGNDAYFVENTGDAVTENQNAGNDTVNANLTYTLPTYIENLALVGIAALNGTGNSSANVLTGNSAANQLNGQTGNDTINGGAGNDTLIGGTGADTLQGGQGDDSYVVENTTDTVTELLNQGTDTVSTQLTYTLSNNVENLSLTGTAAVNGTGNGLANILTGNTAANQLNGLAGNDTLSGGAGNDTLDGGTGVDQLTGGSGNDVFKFTTAGSIDSITDFNVVNDTMQLENAVFTRLNTGTLASGQFRIGTQAQDGNDFIIYNNNTGALLYDANGNSAGASVQIATLSAGLALTNADFVVI